MAVAALLLLLAPEGQHELAYRFEKGLVYEDRSSRHFTLELIARDERNARDKLLRFEEEVHQEMRRTVLEVDADGLPRVERIEVKRFVKVVKDSPKEEPNEKLYPSHGQTFVWRRKENGKDWGLYGAKGEVTDRFPYLVERLHNWRDARLPKKPVEVGATWKVSARRFLETVGQRVPDDVKGGATFTLAAVEDGVARIEFTFKQEHRDGERLLTGSQEGTWRFDVERGRDLALEMKGKLRVDRGRGGVGTFRMERTLTYPDGS